MAQSPRPVFLAPAGYRRKRLRDGARLLPAFGLAMLLVPLLWTPSAEGGVGNAGALLYLFGAWTLLVLAAAALARPLARDGDGDGDGDGGGGGGGEEGGGP